MKDGGPAFPDGRVFRSLNLTTKLPEDIAPNPGMSLRDYFAASALSLVETKWAYDPDFYMIDLEKAARHAYKIADAMLIEREKGG